MYNLKQASFFKDDNTRCPYKVKRNESLNKIASKLSMKPNRLYEINSKIIDADATLVVAGTVLRYPLVSKMHCFMFIENTYKVGKPNTLERIAKQLKVNPVDLYEWNKQIITNKAFIKSGTHLYFEQRVRENMWG